MGKIIQLKNVSKNYGTKKVLEKINFAVEAGTFTTLIGCNGAGKSTTLRLIAGVERIEHGSVLTLDEDPYDFQFPHRSDLFFIHENYQLAFPVNLLEMVQIYREVFPNWSNEIFNEILRERKFSIKKQFADLSRGQKMQFLLMMALASRPKLMLLDEITAVIDIDGQRYFLDKLKEYTQTGGSVVITTNILTEMNEYTDHLILLQESKLLVDTKAEEIKRKFYILKKTEEHPIFSHEKAAKIRKDLDGLPLFIIPRNLVDEDTHILKFKTDYLPRLEDILILHFKLNQESFDEALVA
jgi:ABC-2 type transport system ATP-binding protein